MFIAPSGNNTLADREKDSLHQIMTWKVLGREEQGYSNKVEGPPKCKYT